MNNVWSIIIASIDDARFAAVSAMYARLLAGEELEIIRISNARSLSQAYNHGIAQSRGDRIIFSHDDIEILDTDFPARLRRGLESADMLGVAGTTRLAGPRWVGCGPPWVYGQIAQIPKGPGYLIVLWSVPRRLIVGMQALDGVFLCTTRRVAQAIGFDEHNFDGFHLYDIDFTFRAHLAGFKLAVCADLPMIHASLGNFGDTWERYAQRFIQKHQPRLAPAVTPREYVLTQTRVGSKADVLDFYNPPHFDL